MYKKKTVLFIVILRRPCNHTRRLLILGVKKCADINVKPYWLTNRLLYIKSVMVRFARSKHTTVADRFAGLEYFYGIWHAAFRRRTSCALLSKYNNIYYVYYEFMGRGPIIFTRCSTHDAETRIRTFTIIVIVIVYKFEQLACMHIDGFTGNYSATLWRFIIIYYYAVFFCAYGIRTVH
jgi:hypothetical protein